MFYSNNNYPILSHKSINTYISDYDIYSFYLGGAFKIGQAFNSPFHKDRTPSFAIHEIAGGKLLYKDFAKGLNGNVIGFVKELNNLSNNEEAILKIYKDLIFNTNRKPLDPLKVKKEYKSRSIDLGVKRQPFNQTDLDWWGNFNITKNILTKFEVSAIKYLFVGPYIKHEYKVDNPMYVYTVYDKVKIYRPLAKKTEKWYGTLTRNYIHGYKQLPETGNLLIITKSLKDLMCLYSLGYTAISPSSEGTLVPEHIMNKLKKRFKKIIVFYDNDEAGIAYSKRMCERYKLEEIRIPLKHGEKDTSDLFRKYKQIHYTKSIINDLVNKSKVSENTLIPDEKEKKKSGN